MAVLNTPWFTLSLRRPHDPPTPGEFAMDCCHQALGLLRSGPPAVRDWAHERRSTADRA